MPSIEIAGTASGTIPLPSSPAEGYCPCFVCCTVAQRMSSLGSCGVVQEGSTGAVFILTDHHIS